MVKSDLHQDLLLYLSAVRVSEQISTFCILLIFLGFILKIVLSDFRL